jgi:hypothetical protein
LRRADAASRPHDAGPSRRRADRRGAG